MWEEWRNGRGLAFDKVRGLYVEPLPGYTRPPWYTPEQWRKVKREYTRVPDDAELKTAGDGTAYLSRPGREPLILEYGRSLAGDV